MRTGKRGNFVLAIVEWCVFDPAKDDTILLGDPLPKKPWLECLATVFPFKRWDEQFTVRLFLMSHHAMQRLAEWCGARTPDDLLAAIRELWGAVERMIDWDDAINKALDGEKSIPLRRPKYVPIAGGRAAFEWDETRDKGVPVVTTILDAEMAV
jgi:hypothetical protein